MRFQITTRLTPREVDQAFALIQIEAPEMTLAGWRSFARSAGQAAPAQANRRRAPSLAAVKDARGYLSGLCSYRKARSLRHGEVLAVDCFVALDFLNTQGAADLLLHHLEETASAVGCSAIEITLARQDTRLIDQFRGAGHALEGVLLCKPLLPV